MIDETFKGHKEAVHDAYYLQLPPGQPAAVRMTALDNRAPLSKVLGIGGGKETSTIVKQVGNFEVDLRGVYCKVWVSCQGTNRWVTSFMVAGTRVSLEGIAGDSWWVTR